MKPESESPPMKALTKIELNMAGFAKLKSLRRQISDGHEAVEKYVKSARDNAQNAVREAVLAGEALIEVKEILGHGKFGQWLKKHCPFFSERTAQKYMAMSRSFPNHGSDLPTNLRKAYLQLGIINEPTAAAPALPNATMQLANGDEPAPAEIVNSTEVPQPAVEVETEIVSPSIRVNFDRRLCSFKASLDSLLLDLDNLIENGYSFAELETLLQTRLNESFERHRPGK